MIARFVAAALSLVFVSAKGVTPTSLPADEEHLKARYPFIAHWRGPSSVGTAILISPTWLLTAGHVAKLKAEDPTRKIEIRFDNGEKFSVVEAVIAPEGDVALAKLSSRSKIEPAHLLDHAFKKEDGEISFTLAGHSGGLHVHPGRNGHADSERKFRHDSTKEDPTPGRAGDSGGAWAIDDGEHAPIVFATIHGSGIGSQVAPLREWIDGTMKKSGEAPTWEPWKK